VTLLVLAASLLAQAAPAPAAAAFPDLVQSLDAVPKQLKLVGKPVAARRWTDKLGVNLLVISETARVGEASGGNKQLHGYQFTQQGDSWKPLWHVKDGVFDCDFDLELELVPASVSVTDLDGDGTAETAFAYTRTCTSDVSPSDLKVLLHEGTQKYALRGTTRIELGPGEFEGGARKPDAALARAPKPFLAHAQKLFDASGGKEEKQR
jgi:hypothetical protein